MKKRYLILFLGTFLLLFSSSAFSQKKVLTDEEEVTEIAVEVMDYDSIVQNFLSAGTIRKHVENIYTKLQVHNKLEAIQKAKNNKLI